MAGTDDGKNGGGKNMVRRRASCRQNFCLPNISRWVTLWAMSDGALSLRLARPGDAVPLARIYVEAWRDTYAAILPHRLLANMSVDMHAARLERAIRKGAVLAAETPRHGVLGLAGFGAARDHGLGFDGEVYTLYVDPDFMGCGVGRTLLHGAFAQLQARAFHSCLIWSHAQNHACFFYEAMGGTRMAERRAMLGGQDVGEVAFGWKTLALSPRRRLAI
jgi:ribosomal protein S18 acetylase RimI-like enzyme